jgi:hypothetical protein
MFHKGLINGNRLRTAYIRNNIDIPQLSDASQKNAVQTEKQNDNRSTDNIHHDTSMPDSNNRRNVHARRVPNNGHLNKHAQAKPTQLNARLMHNNVRRTPERFSAMQVRQQQYDTMPAQSVKQTTTLMPNARFVTNRALRPQGYSNKKHTRVIEKQMVLN